MNSFLHEIHMKKYMWNFHENTFGFTACFSWTFSHEFHMLWFCLCIGSTRFVESWFISQVMLVLCLSHTDSSNSLPGLRENLHRLYTTDRFLDTRRSSDLITNMFLRFVFWVYHRLPRRCLRGVLLYIVRLHCSTCFPASLFWCFYLVYNWSYLLQTSKLISNLSEGT